MTISTLHARFGILYAALLAALHTALHEALHEALRLLFSCDAEKPPVQFNDATKNI